MITDATKNEISTILEQIDKLAKENGVQGEYNEISNEIREELSKENPVKTLVKRCFQVIPSFFMGVNTGLVANALTPLINEAVNLLS